MLKHACLAVLLGSSFGVAQTSKPAAFTSPQIVAKAKLPNQTAPIPTRTIFTPAQTGLYRLSIYATVVKADPSSQSYWYVNPAWTDDSGAVSQAGGVLFLPGTTAGPFEFDGVALLGGDAFVFEAVAGMPITISVTQGGPSDNSSYSLYYTLERLE